MLAHEIGNFQCFTHSYGVWRPFFINFGSKQRDFYGLSAYETIKSMKEMEFYDFEDRSCVQSGYSGVLTAECMRDTVENHLRPACNAMEVTKFFHNFI